MASKSGVACHARVDICYQEIKAKSSLSYFLCVIKNKDGTVGGTEKKDQVIMVEQEAKPECTFADFKDYLEEHYKGKCVYGVYDFKYKKEGAPQQKLICFKLNDDDASVKEKMLYASSYDAFKKTCNGAAKYLEVGPDDIDFDNFLKLMK
jgi:cofilin